MQAMKLKVFFILVFFVLFSFLLALFLPLRLFFKDPKLNYFFKGAGVVQEYFSFVNFKNVVYEVFLKAKRFIFIFNYALKYFLT